MRRTRKKARETPEGMKPEPKQYVGEMWWINFIGDRYRGPYDVEETLATLEPLAE